MKQAAWFRLPRLLWGVARMGLMWMLASALGLVSALASAPLSKSTVGNCGKHLDAQSANANIIAFLSASQGSPAKSESALNFLAGHGRVIN